MGTTYKRNGLTGEHKGGILPGSSNERNTENTNGNNDKGDTSNSELAYEGGLHEALQFHNIRNDISIYHDNAETTVGWGITEDGPESPGLSKPGMNGRSFLGQGWRQDGLSARFVVEYIVQWFRG